MINQILDRITFEAGKIIFEEGDDGDFAYIIESGEVEISKIVSGEWKVLALMHEHAMFGELALVDAKPRIAMARARTAVTVIRVSHSMFSKKLEEADIFLRGLLKILVENARNSGVRQTAGFIQTDKGSPK